MKYTHLILSCLVIVISAGCAHSPSYSWGFGNYSHQLFEHVALQRGHDAAPIELVNLGHVPVNGGGRITPGPRPMPDDGEMVWMTMPDMQMHSQPLQIATQITHPERFDGTVWIVYRDDRWVLVPITHAEAERRSLSGEEPGP